MRKKRKEKKGEIKRDKDECVWRRGKKKKNRDQELEKDLREWQHFLNEGEKERKEGEIKRDKDKHVWRRKKQKRMDEMKGEKGEIV